MGNKKITEAAPKVVKHEMDIWDAGTASKTAERAIRDRNRSLEIASIASSAENAAKIAEQQGDAARADSLRKAVADLKRAVLTKGQSNSEQNINSDSSSERSSDQESKGKSQDKDSQLDKKNNKNGEDGEEDESKVSSKNNEKDSPKQSNKKTGGEDKTETSSDNSSEVDGQDQGQGQSDEGEDGEENSNSQIGSDKNKQGDKDEDETGEGEEEGTDSETDEKDTDSENQQAQNGHKKSSGSGGQSQSKSKPNPFEIDPENSTMRGGSGSKSSQADKTGLDDIIAILKELTGDARQGAVSALKDILQKKNVDISQLDQTLFESVSATLPKGNPLDWDDDTYNDYMNALVDEISAITGTQIENEQEREDRIKKIDAQRNSKIWKRDLQQEDERNKFDDPVYQAELRRQREIDRQKYRSTRQLRSIGTFLNDLKSAINNQIEEYLVYLDDPSRLNRYHQDDGMVVSGTSSHWELEEQKPIINVYFDMSGSWVGDKKALALGESIMATLRKYEDQKLLVLNRWYFSDRLTKDIDDPCLGDGTSAFPEIINNIVNEKAKNVILMTDMDFDGCAKPSRHVKVDGCVWYIWRNGRVSQTALEYLGSVDSHNEFQYTL